MQDRWPYTTFIKKISVSIILRFLKQIIYNNLGQDMESKFLRRLIGTQVVLRVKNLPISAGDVGDMGSIPGSGRLPGGGHGNPLQHSWLDNPMDRGAWWATVHRITKSWTRLKWLRMHAPIGRNPQPLPRWKE